MDTEEKTVFCFSELSDRAKQRAIERYAAGEDYDWDPRDVIDDCMPVITAFGFEVEHRTVRLVSGKTRQEPIIYYDVGYRTSGDAAFPGWWKAEDVKPAQVLEDRPTDEDLCEIAAKLMLLIMRYPLAHARFSTWGQHDTNISMGDVFSGQEDEDGDDIDMPEADHKLLVEIIEALCDWLGACINDHYEWNSSHERIAEQLADSDDLYDEDGDLL